MTMNDATRVQVDAADPRHSTWLSANAGSGKTRVLTDRVARLLLRGTRPQDVLCLTYTKAAASEMQNRLFRTLGTWAMMPDASLATALAELGERDISDLDMARTLFARAIETPGGLRIQTIHSFCASIIRQFPVEAGVTPEFRELDADEASHLLAEVVDDLAREDSPELLGFLACHDGDALAAVTASVVASRADFATERRSEDLAARLGVSANSTRSEIDLCLIARIHPDWWNALRDAISGTNKTNDAIAARMAVDARALGPEDTAWLDATFANSSNDNSKAGRWPAKPIRAELAAHLDEIDDFLDAVIDHRVARRAMECRDRSTALHAFAQVLLREYDTRKRALGVLDFDDLIEKTAALLGNATRDWVRYRLDARIEHILVDEAQDTSPEQWAVISALADELTAGEGARSRDRSLFVVGDRKQSIYSFQGADAAAFDAMQDHFAARLEDAPTPLAKHELQYSFRSSAAVLHAADAVLDHLAGAHRLHGRHKAFFGDLPGRVDLWPAIPAPEKPQDVAWFDPVDRPLEEASQIKLADMVAAEIRRLIDEESIPRAKAGPRPVAPGDILVLVQRRNVMFDRIIRKAQTLGVDIAGPDRLSLMEEIAVKDILAILRFLALPEDDLSLAEALKSPVFGLDEAKLYDLAHGRERARLWQELVRRKDDFAEAHKILRDLLAQADFLRPFELIERILIEHGGRRKLLARLGADAEDAIDELLALSLRFEETAVPDLTSFLAHVEDLEADVKRAAEGAGRKVRVMTVHGAKGLEAPIVILPDTIRAPRPDLSPLFFDAEGVPFLRSASKDATALQDDAKTRRAAAERAEAERLLYVAMTRAESWLIVCGAEGRNPGGFWHDAVSDAFSTLDEVEAIDTPAGPGRRLRHGTWPTRSADEDGGHPEVNQTDIPKLPAVPEATRKPAPLNPSDLGGEKTLGAAGSHSDPRFWGTAIHLLLEHLPDHPASDHRNLAVRILQNAAIPTDVVDPDSAVAACASVMAAHPELFSGDTLREVPVSGLIDGREMTGTIDLLHIEGARVRVVDFKTNHNVPERPEDVPSGILRQMGAYKAALDLALPSHEKIFQILWTTDQTLMTLPHGIVSGAFDGTTTS